MITLISSWQIKQDMAKENTHRDAHMFRLLSMSGNSQCDVNHGSAVAY